MDGSQIKSRFRYMGFVYIFKGPVPSRFKQVREVRRFVSADLRLQVAGGQ